MATSSSAIGGQESIQSQLSGNLSFLDSSNNLSDQASEALGKANEDKTNAQLFGGVASVASFGYNHAADINSIFKPKSPATAAPGTPGNTMFSG